jgi:hypothetical protein
LLERHEALLTLESRAVEPADKRRVYQAQRSLARVGEYFAMKMLLEEEGLRTQSSRQEMDLPWVRSEMQSRGLWMPPFPNITDELIEIGELEDDDDEFSDHHPVADQQQEEEGK